MKKNSVSIYGVSASPIKKGPSWGTYTRKGKTLYAHVYRWPKNAPDKKDTVLVVK